MNGSYKLTEQQFGYIVEQADAVLKKNAVNISIVGISWLHVLNSHPANQAKYVYVFNKRSIFLILKNFFSRSVFILADLVLSAFSVFGGKSAYKNIPADTEVLLISHLVDAKAKKHDEDFYFKELPGYLQQHQHKTAVGLLNHTTGFTGWDDESHNKENNPEKFLIPRRLDLLSELSILLTSLLTAFRFLRQTFSETSTLKKSFLWELTRNVFAVDTFRAARIYRVIQYITANTNCKVIALTWEGHGWERLVCQVARTAQRKIVCIGYQHTILFPSSHALKRSITKMYNPDIILTVGSITKKILESSPDLAGVQIMEYGSPRLVAKKSYDENRPVKNGCLVAPEGLPDECIQLFSFAIETARLLPEVDFIFRTHPTVTFQDIQLRDTRLQNLPCNIIVSSFKDMNDDFERSSWLLYRGSSVSLFAILAGLRPVYMQAENELSVDPLYKLTEWRLQVTIPGELADIINKDVHTGASAENEKARKAAVIFSETYMKPYDVSVFERCILQQN